MMEGLGCLKMEWNNTGNMIFDCMCREKKVIRGRKETLDLQELQVPQVLEDHQERMEPRAA